MWWTILVQIILFVLDLFLKRSKRGEQLSAKEQREFAKVDAKWNELRTAAM